MRTLALLALLIAAPAAARDDPPSIPAGISVDTLETFRSESDFRNYLRTVKREGRKRKLWWAALNGTQVAQAEDTPCLNPEDCPELESSAAAIVVTGARAAKANPSITNTQEAGVDEGDIVKQIGPFLLVLQDGRIFSVDTRAAGLALADRVNVYRDKDSGTWYDEMLVQGDRVVVTGFSYEEEATEVSVFRLDDAGRFHAQGVFLISSNDYYDSSNYATRLVGDRLIVYSPLDPDDFDLDDPFPWPVVRRWAPEDERDAAIARGKRLFDARTIYRPVQPTLAPIVHTVSVCPLGEVGPRRALECRTTAFVGPIMHQFYVSPRDAYLWVTPSWSEYETQSQRSACDSWGRRGPSEAHPAALFRIPLSGDLPGFVRARGVPIDQFSLDVGAGKFRALLRWEPIRCGAPQMEAVEDLRYFEMPLSRFAAEAAEIGRGAYTALPSEGTRYLENRFTENWLVYAGRPNRGTYAPDGDKEAPFTTTAVAVPLGAPERATVVPVPHGVIRVEQAGGDAVLTGYRDSQGLGISLLDLSAVPKLASTVRLDRRYESEGRSHAFNSLVGPDGNGLLGLPTVLRPAESGRHVWRSDSSDVSFLSVTARRLASLGALEGHEDTADERYACEVSCIDWYGNSRPIFTDGRVFALSGTELIEGRVGGGRIAEVRRLNLTVPVGHAR
jgi:hypothetical protein